MGESQTQHFYDFGTFERVPKPRNQLFLSLETPGYLTKSRRSQLNFENTMFLNVDLLGNPQC